MAEYENVDWFRNYLTMLEENIRRLEDRKVDCVVYEGQIFAINQEIKIRFEALTEAKRLMEGRMAGFPAEFAKKSELDQTAALVKDLKDSDLKEIKERIETNTINKLSKDEYGINHETLRKDINDLIKAKERMEGKASQTSLYITAVIALFSLLLGAIHVVKDFAK